MTEVRIRHEYESEGAVLGDVPFGDIGDVIPSLQSWGLRAQHEDGSDFVDRQGMSGEFVYDAVRDVAYFEITISE